jgi:RNA polymerase sigma factor for flagellar operon FliA
MQKLTLHAEELTNSELIDRYLYLIYSIANQINKKFFRAAPIEELVQYGVIGLLESSKRFDPGKGVDFATFAYYRIRGSIYDGLREMGILLPSIRKLQKKTAPPKSEDQLSCQLEDVETAIAGLLADCFQLISIDDVEEPQVPCIQSQNAELKQLSRVLTNAICDLPTFERELIFGMYYNHNTAVEICNSLKISKSWGSKLHAGGLRKLKRRLLKEGFSSP